MVNFGPLAAEICWRVWGTPANFNGFSRLGSVTARHLVVGATYIRQGDHHVWLWPTFLVQIISAIVQRFNSVLLHNGFLKGRRSPGKKCRVVVVLFPTCLKLACVFVLVEAVGVNNNN